MLDARRLKVLLAIREHGSISAAARTLSFTPPAVSQQIAALERQLGVALLDRTLRSVRLTEAGQRLATHAERVLTQLETAAADMAAMNEHVGGVLRIGSLPTIGAGLLPETLRRLRETTPGLLPQVEQMELDQSLPALKRGELDAALVGEYSSVPQRLDPTLERHDLLVEPVLVAVPEGHGQPGPSVRVPALRDESWVAPAPGSTCLALLERACGLAGFAPTVVAHCGDFAMAQALVRAELGIALVPAIARLPGRAPHGLRYLTPTEPAVRRTLFLAARRGSGEGPGIRRLREAAAEAVAAMTPVLSP